MSRRRAGHARTGRGDDAGGACTRARRARGAARRRHGEQWWEAELRRGRMRTRAKRHRGGGCDPACGGCNASDADRSSGHLVCQMRSAVTVRVADGGAGLGPGRARASRRWGAPKSMSRGEDQTRDDSGSNAVWQCIHRQKARVCKGQTPARFLGAPKPRIPSGCGSADLPVRRKCMRSVMPHPQKLRPQSEINAPCRVSTDSHIAGSTQGLRSPSSRDVLQNVVNVILISRGRRARR